MIRKYYFVLIIFLLIFVNSNFVYAQEIENSDGKKKVSEILQKFEEHSGLAQWFIVIVLIASAGLVLKQIKTQNIISRSQNFLELIKMVSSTEYIHSLNLIFEEYENNPNSFAVSDSKLPEDIKKAVLRIKNDNRAIGLMIHAKMIGEVEFLKLHSREARDAWNILKINHEKTNEERNKNKKRKDEYYSGFRILGLTSSFWLRLSYYERLWVVGGYVGVSPGTMYYIIRMGITDSLEKISKKVNRELLKKILKKTKIKCNQVQNQLKVKILKNVEK